MLLLGAVVLWGPGYVRRGFPSSRFLVSSGWVGWGGPPVVLFLSLLYSCLRNASVRYLNVFGMTN